MRVAVFTNTYFPTVNGVVNSIEAFHTGLQEAGHEVFVFAPRAAEPFAEEPHVFRFPARSLRRYPEYPVALPWSGQLRRAFAGLDVDIVHTQHPWLIGKWGADTARRLGVPVITTVHTQYEQYAHYARPVPPRLLGGVIRRAVVGHCRQCDIVATPGESMKAYLLALGVTQPVEVVPNATNLEGFDTADGRGVREAAGMAPADVLFAFVGRVAREKSLDTLIRAFTRVAVDLPSAKLMIVGGGPALAELKRLAASQPCAARIILTGLVPYAEIKEYHAAADVFVTASVTEVQPLSLAEAMAAWTPVVGFDAGGVCDMIRHGETGLLASPEGGAEALAAAMGELGADPERRARLAEAAQQDSRRYHIREATDRLIQVYQAAIARHGQHG